MARPVLPPIPNELRAWLLGISRAVEVWFDNLQKLLSNLEAITWTLIDKTGSNLTDIETRNHNDLQNTDAADAHPWDSITKAGSELQDIGTRPHSHLTDVLGGVDQHHVQESERSELTALDALGSGMVAKTADATYAARTVSGTTGKVDVANGSGVSANPTITLPAVITGGQKFGTDATDNSEFEADGTLKFNGAATVFRDVFFPMAPPKATGAGNPTLTTWNGNLRGYTFAVGDVHDFDPQEFSHEGKEGSTATWHIHFVSRTNVGADRTVKYQLEYSQANRNAVFPSPTTVSSEIVIPANTTALTHIAENISTFTTGEIAGQMFVRLTRIASSGTEPEDDPVIIGVHYHFEVDTVGSRAVFSK